MTDAIAKTVIDIVALKQGLKPERILPEMSFCQLGIDGDDAIELIEAVCDRFLIDVAEIDLRRYTIGPEGWGFGLNSPPRQFVSLKWSAPKPVDLRVSHLIRSAEAGRWFDPVSSRANW